MLMKYWKDNGFVGCGEDCVGFVGLWLTLSITK